MRQTFLITVLAALLLSACNSSQKATVEGAAKTRSKATEKIAIKSSDFAINLFVLVCQTAETENISISPVGAAQILSMLANGAEGNTLAQIEGLLNTRNNVSDSAVTARCDTATELSVANSIWIDEKLKVKQPFIKANEKCCNATVRNLRFSNEALKTINSWCAEKSNGKIRAILDKLDESTSMLLLNAIYFKARWLMPFSERMTSEHKFTKENGKEISVNMMNERFTTAYFGNDTMQIVSRPFAGGRFVMYFILPHDSVSISALTGTFAKSYRNWQANMQKGTSVIFGLPRFKVECGGSLKPLLQAMGVTDAFDKRADFTSVSDTPLFVDDIIQKNFINVDESGVEAASVTAATMAMLSARPKECTTMILNRPFIFIIEERSNNDILFIGKIGEPEES